MSGRKADGLQVGYPLDAVGSALRAETHFSLEQAARSVKAQQPTLSNAKIAKLVAERFPHLAQHATAESVKPLKNRSRARILEGFDAVEDKRIDVDAAEWFDGSVEDAALWVEQAVASAGGTDGSRYIGFQAKQGVDCGVWLYKAGFSGSLEQLDTKHHGNYDAEFSGWTAFLHQAFRDTDGIHPAYRLAPSTLYEDDFSVAKELEPLRCTKWLRPGRGEGLHDHQPALCLFNTVEPSDLAQDALGDCWLMSGLATLAEVPKRVQTLCRQSELAVDGRYDIKLFDPQRNEWTIVSVDDRLPVQSNNWMRCAQITDEAEIFPALYEVRKSRVQFRYFRKKQPICQYESRIRMED